MGGHHRRVASQKLLAPSEESRAEPKKAREAERACMHACLHEGKTGPDGFQTRSEGIASNFPKMFLASKMEKI
ncbi:hypothetical protein ATANTOWER_027595 [Ataeniobius toweri]|uniref:Uncharacterized protein n=1 Tax=Ataeniobius toweri TaxID=208326 RepID=A0ABU7B9S7_9TELE|nr:hypothetical protein [Ataeniobius toweri]